MDQGFQAEKLRLARQLKGMSLAELGMQVGASRQYIHQLESDAKAPSQEMEAALAAVLEVQQSFFRSPLRSSVKVEQTHFRRLRTTPLNLVHQVLAYGTLYEQLVNLLDRILLLPAVNFPMLQVGSADEIEAAAEYCRSFWGLEIGRPISNMTRVLENAGAVVVSINNVSEKIDALSMSRARPIVVRSSRKESLCRLRFDLAHECGHLVMHQGIQTGDKETEAQAHRFAGAFLIPSSAFRKEFPEGRRIDWRTVFEMKLKWKVSAQAIIRRALDLEIIDDAQYRRAQIQIRRNGQAKQEKFDDEMPLEHPELLQKCFDMLLSKRRLYPEGIADQLSIRMSLLGDLVSFIPVSQSFEGENRIFEGESNIVSFRHDPSGKRRA